MVEHGRPSIAVVDPRTGETIGAIPAGDADTARQAVSRARSAAATWSRLPAGVRSQALRTAAERLDEIVDELAAIESLESGRPIGDAIDGVRAGIDSFRHFAEAADEQYFHQEISSGDFIRRRPFGVAALIVPWNFPLLIAFRFLPGLLAAGNTVVWKPSEKTPLSAVRVVEALTGVFPDGVVELLLGDGRAGAPLVEDPHVDVVALTGSTRTGVFVGEVSGRLLRPALLELGGKDAVIVDDVADPESIARRVAEGCFSNTGQICTSMERVYVHRSVADRFIEALVEEARTTWRMEVEEGGRIGPLIDEMQRQIVRAHVADAVSAGARVLAGGAEPDRPGYWYPATVLVDVTPEMRIMTEETFGPIAPVMVVDSLADAVSRVNMDEYGLAVTLFTDDVDSAAAIDTFDVGIVWVNSWHGYAEGALHEAGGRSGLGAVGWRGASFLDAVTAPQFVKRPSVR
jgi:succinate-semialdehyde dehydrogenase/glutarate-semialdehyde dehydrogenase